jgi:hypothetical protein
MSEDSAELCPTQVPLSLTEVKLTDLDPLPDTGWHQTHTTLRRLRVLLRALRNAEKISCSDDVDWYLHALQRAIYRACGVPQ